MRQRGTSCSVFTIEEQSLAVTVIKSSEPTEWLHSHHMWLSSQETVKSCHRWLVTDDSVTVFAILWPSPWSQQWRRVSSLPHSLCLRCQDQVALALTDSFGTFILLTTDNSECSCCGLSPANSGGILMAPPRAQWSENYFFRRSIAFIWYLNRTVLLTIHQLTQR